MVDRMGVVVLLAHLVIFIMVLGAYVYSMAKGHPDDSLKTYLGMMMAYWFGAIGKDMLKSKDKN
jgi:hypothetical protein